MKNTPGNHLTELMNNLPNELKSKIRKYLSNPQTGADNLMFMQIVGTGKYNGPIDFNKWSQKSGDWKIGNFAIHTDENGRIKHASLFVGDNTFLCLNSGKQLLFGDISHMEYISGSTKTLQFEPKRTPITPVSTRVEGIFRLE